MNKDAYYFSHDSNARHDTKIIKLRSKFGAAGYAFYFMTLEILRDQSNYSIDLNDIDAIAYDMQCERNAYLDFIEFGIEIGLFIKKNEKISSNSFLNRMNQYEIKRGKARQSALKRWSNREKKGNANAMRTHSEGNAIDMHLKEKKVNIKENEIKENLTVAIATPQAEFIQSFSKLYESETNSPYKADSKDYILIAGLIKKYTCEAVTAKARVLFSACKSRSMWFTKGGMANFRVGALSSHWNELIDTQTAGDSVRDKILRGDL